MSQHSDEHISGASNSFWEVGNYKWTTKRIEDGHRLCDDLMKLVQERAEIEKAYAKSLKDWSKKWNGIIVKGPEYGTTEAAWLGVLIEADQRYDLHTRVKENLINDIHSNVKVWQKDHYHKSMMGQLKEKKDIEDMFKKAQKQWSKYYEKTMKAKHEYHNACKNERTAQNQERNAGGDSSLSPDQRHQAVRKLQDRVSKSKDEVQKTKEKYEQALSEISSNNPKYIEDMGHVFEKTQESEQERLEFFKKMLFSTHKCLNISQDQSLPRIYEELHHTVSNAEYEKDLMWWSNKYGVNMPMCWPAFEDYNPEMHRITKRGIAKGHVGGINDDVTLKSINETKHTSPTSSKASENNRHSAISESHQQPNPFDEDEDNSANNGVSAEEDEWDYSDRLVDPNKPGVPVRALYDYEGVEDDELSFKIGETFEKLEDQDEQGWCTGRKDGRIGLYPANYVDVV